jgi:DNA-binding GntR family transcriptional regulator
MKIKNIEKLPNENNRNYAYRVLKENIMELYIKPGEPLMEIEVSNYLNVSRTPIREAFIKLSEEKLLDIYPQKGTYVSLIDIDLVEQAIFARSTLEKKVIELACEEFSDDLLKELKKICSFQKSIISISEDPLEFYTLDNKFHKTLFEGCKKGRVWEMIELLSTHYNRLRALDALSGRNLSIIVAQHEAIVDTIENKNFDLINSVIDEHLSNYKHTMLKENFKQYFKA